MTSLVTFYCFHEALCYSITHRTPHRRVLRFKSQHPSELACFINPVVRVSGRKTSQVATLHTHYNATILVTCVSALPRL